MEVWHELCKNNLVSNETRNPRQDRIDDWPCRVNYYKLKAKLGENTGQILTIETSCWNNKIMPGFSISWMSRSVLIFYLCHLLCWQVLTFAIKSFEMFQLFCQSLLYNWSNMILARWHIWKCGAHSWLGVGCCSGVEWSVLRVDVACKTTLDKETSSMKIEKIANINFKVEKFWQSMWQDSPPDAKIREIVTWLLTSWIENKM